MDGKGSKAKGSSFERQVCKDLSRWLSRGMREDLFWRSAMSGGRATVRMKRGGKAASQLGDITAIDTQGQRLTDRFVIECKSYKDLQWPQAMMGKTSRVIEFWERLVKDAAAANRLPMLIARQNILGTFIVLNPEGHGVLYPGRMRGTILPDAHVPVLSFDRRMYLYSYEGFMMSAKRP